MSCVVRLFSSQYLCNPFATSRGGGDDDDDHDDGDDDGDNDDGGDNNNRNGTLVTVMRVVFVA